MKYEELNNLWKSQREQYQLWEIRLLQHAKNLRDHFEDKLSLPHKSWLAYETKEQHFYVELVDFSNKSKPERKSPNNKSITPEGILAFGISITFDYGPDTYPKRNIFIPIAITYKDKQLEYSMFDIEAGESFGGWTKDKDTLYSNATKRLHEYLSHDPHNGFGQSKKAIGFLG